MEPPAPRRLLPPRVLNLTLHGVGQPTRPLERGEANVWLPADLLGPVLDALAGRSDVHLTVDDGNSSDISILLEELALRDLKASFFVVAARLGQRGFLSGNDLERLLSAGHRVGSHGMHHRDLHGLQSQQLEEELSTARDMLESLSGTPITELAFPFGSYDRRVLRRARELGYVRVFTSDGGTADPQAWLQPRTTISCRGEPSPTDILHAPPSARLMRRAKRTAKQWR